MTKEGCIINPVTGRAVKTTTKLGKKLVALADRLDDEYKGEKVLKTAAKRALAQKEAGDKNKAGGVLAAAAKRAIAKKPDPPKPAKKFGFEDLPGDVKDIITGKVYDNMSDKELLKYLKERMSKLNMTYPGYTKYNKIQLIKAIKDSFDFEKKNNIKPTTDDDFKDEYKNKKRNEMIKKINETVDDLTDGGKIPALNKLKNKDLYYLLYEGGIEEKFEKYINKKSKKKKKMTIADVIQIPPSSP